jgi:predicted HicB family RNase H-like nuclease
MCHASANHAATSIAVATAVEWRRVHTPALRASFENGIDDYLAHCAKRGETPGFEG